MTRPKPRTRAPLRVTPALLRSWPLPMPSAEAGKEERGRLLIVAGADDVPGAAVLAAEAALRSGIGKLCIATARSIMQCVAQSVPEARVVPFASKRNANGGSRPDVGDFDVVLIGPGMESSRALSAFARAMAKQPVAMLVLDAGAIDATAQMTSMTTAARTKPKWPACIVTPHAGEMAKLMNLDKAEVEARGKELATSFARTRNIVVVLKGAKTFIADPEGSVWLHDYGNPGLAVSGSGDCLAGIIAGLGARGASPAQAAVWGVALHGLAGAELAAQYGPLGALARELPSRIPALMERMRRGTRSSHRNSRRIR